MTRLLARITAHGRGHLAQTAPVPSTLPTPRRTVCGPDAHMH